MEAPFAASYIKLERANGFIEELAREIQAYQDSNPATAKLDVPAGKIHLNIRGPGSKPGAIVGDAIHNMRTALDLMASELARNNSKSDKDVYFPFSKDKDDLAAAIKARSFHKAGEEAVKLLCQFAPYKGGNDALRGIHDLDIQDKHTAIVLLTHKAEAEFVARYNLDHRNDDHVSITATFHFVFKDGPFEGRGVVETLKELVELVNGIVKAFAAIPKGEAATGRWHSGPGANQSARLL